MKYTELDKALKRYSNAEHAISKAHSEVKRALKTGLTYKFPKKFIAHYKMCWWWEVKPKQELELNIEFIYGDLFVWLEDLHIDLGSNSSEFDERISAQFGNWIQPSWFYPDPEGKRVRRLLKKYFIIRKLDSAKDFLIPIKEG